VHQPVFDFSIVMSQRRRDSVLARRQKPGATSLRSEHANEKRAIRSRLDFSKIPPQPDSNLIEVQRRSYERFLQMDKLPNERDDNGLQSVFVSVFPIATSAASRSWILWIFDRQLECKCGTEGLHHLRTACVHCGQWSLPILSIPAMCSAEVRTYNKNTPTFATSAAIQ